MLALPLDLNQKFRILHNRRQATVFALLVLPILLVARDCVVGSDRAARCRYCKSVGGLVMLPWNGMERKALQGSGKPAYFNKPVVIALFAPHLNQSVVVAVDP